MKFKVGDLAKVVDLGLGPVWDNRLVKICACKDGDSVYTVETLYAFQGYVRYPEWGRSGWQTTVEPRNLTPLLNGLDRILEDL